MLIASFAVLGLVVGVGLDWLIVRLAVPPSHDDSGPDTAVRQPSTLAAEHGSLVVSAESTDWPRRLAVMAATAGFFALAAARFAPAHIAVVAAYCSVLIVCAGTDLLAYRVPNVVTYPAILGAMALGIAMPDADVWEVLAGGGLAGGVLLLPALLTGGIGMGMGDVKLAAFVGLAIGFTNAAPAMLIMALLGGATAVFLLATGLRAKGQPIPYAPFISVGGLAVIFLQGTAFASV